MIRTVMLRLLPDREAEARLKTLCNISSKLWNEINYHNEGSGMLYISCEVDKKVIKDNSFGIPLKPLGDKEAGIDIGVNNLLAIY
ncbi:MAG: hypothetical protein QXQ57_03500 [Sulfolobales archaeon]